MESACPCGSDAEITECCEPIIQGKKSAETAEQLMRARYTAFTLNDMDFVYSTHDPATREENDWEANRQWANSSQFTGLNIVQVEDGGPGDSKGVIEFQAQFEQDGKAHSHHEKSLFLKKKGQWFFSEAKNPELTTFERAQPKLGRNDPCSCGSGKKFKKCCGA